MLLNWKPWLWAIISIWCLLAFLAWHYESTCGVFFSASCMSQYWEGLRWIILLKWVETFQTLIGGVAALAAGAFVLIAAKHSGKEAREAANAAKRQSAIIACSIIADEFRDANIHVSTSPLGFPSFAQPKFSFTHSSTYMPSLHAIDPMLGSIVSACRRDIDMHLGTRTMSPSFMADRLASAKCLAIWHLLISISGKLSADGTFALSAGNLIPAGELQSLLKGLPVKPKELIGLYYLFDWAD